MSEFAVLNQFAESNRSENGRHGVERDSSADRMRVAVAITAATVSGKLAAMKLSFSRDEYSTAAVSGARGQSPAAIARLRMP